MPLSEPHNLQTNSFNVGSLADVATPSTLNAPIPFRGRVVGAGCSISAALTGADTIVTVQKVGPGGPFEIGKITIPAAGSGPGSSYGMVLTGNEIACTVEAFNSLNFVSGGEGSGPAVANFVAIVRGS